MRATFIVAAVLVLVSSKSYSEDRLPVPEAEQLRNSYSLIKQIYKTQYENAKTSEEKLAFANVLLKVGLATDNDPSGRYVLLKIAGDVAADAGDAKTALAIAERTGKEFDVDLLQLKAKQLKKAQAATRLPKDHQALAPMMNTVLDEAIIGNRFTLAKRLGEVYLDSARLSKKGDWIRAARSKVEEIETISEEYDKARTAFGKLFTDPNDPQANLAAGRFTCFVKGDWTNGIPLLALGSDEALREIATQEMGDNPDKVQIGDSWWSLAENSQGRTQQFMFIRGRYWYQLALPELSGLAKAKVQQRIPQLESDTVPHRVPFKLAYKCVLAYSCDPRFIALNNARTYVLDLSGSQNHGEIIGATPGKDGNIPYLAFDGRDDHVLSINDAPPVSSSFTVSILVKYAGQGAGGKSYWSLINRNTSGDGFNDPYHIFIRAETKTIATRVGNGEDGLDFYPRISVASSKWHHVVLRFDDSENTYSLFFDGQKISQEKVTENWRPVRGSGRLSLGVWPRYRSYFRGGLSDIAIWERRLDDGEIQQLYDMARDGNSYCTAIGDARTGKH